VKAVTELQIPNPLKILLWSIEKVALVENRIWPLCLFNKNNQFQQEQNYQIHHQFVSVANLKRNKIELFARFQWNGSKTTQLVSDPLSCQPKLSKTNHCNRIKHSVCALFDYEKSKFD